MTSNVLHLRVVRFKSDDTTTLSRVYLETDEGRKFLCHGLEDAYHPIEQKDLFKGRIRIPAGTYDVGLHDSPRFRPSYKRRWSDHEELIHILNVPAFTYILWHTGNNHTHTEGCLLLGRWVNGNFIRESRTTYIRVYRLLLPLIKQGGIKVTYEDGDR